MVKINKKFNDFKNSYYFLTNKKYKSLKVRLNKNYNYKEIEYLNLITDKRGNQLWYTFYAMDWISQINFFNRYINHQILYVTGSTGTGKSTQVPKLLLYALKMYEYKSKGKIICTQPRIGPTVNNTERISTEMGVPI